MGAKLTFSGIKLSSINKFTVPLSIPNSMGSSASKMCTGARKDKKPCPHGNEADELLLGRCSRCYRIDLKNQSQILESCRKQHVWPKHGRYPTSPTAESVSVASTSPTTASNITVGRRLAAASPATYSVVPTGGLFAAALLLGGYLLVKCRRALKARRECLKMDAQE